MKISLAKLKETLERIFVFLVLQLSGGGIMILLPRSGNTDVYTELSASYPALQAVWFLIYGITACLLVRRWRQFIRVAKRDILLLLLVGIALASTFWSTAPEITLRRSVALTGTTLFGIYLATRYSSREIFRILVWTLSIAALLSVVFAVVLPSYGTMSGGAWRGIYQHKNSLGRLMAMNAVLLLLLKPRNWSYSWVLWTGVGLSISLVLLSTSKGALVFLLVLLTLLPLYRSLRWNYTLAIPFLITLILVNGSVIIWLLENLEDIVVNKLGKDLTFTGRTVLWEAVIEMIKQRPLLGYGYSGFWQGWEGPSASILSAANWAVPHSHNGILDLCLDLGLVGVTVFMLGLLMNFVRAVRQVRMTKTAADIWPLILLTFIVLSNLVESAILKQNNISWILYVVTVLARPAQRH